MAFAHHKEVFAGAFGYVAVLVEEDGFVETGEDGFGFGEDAVEVVGGGFDLGGGHLVVEAAPGGGAAAEVVGAEVVAEGDDD